MITLTNSNRHQAIVTALITDVNFDSRNEILLGTYGNVIAFRYMIKKWMNKLPNIFCFSTF